MHQDMALWEVEAVNFEVVASAEEAVEITWVEVQLGVQVVAK